MFLRLVIFISIMRARTIMCLVLETKAYYENKRILRLILQLPCMCAVCKSDEF